LLHAQSAVQVSPWSRFPDLLETAKERSFESLNLQKKKQLTEDLFNDFFIHLAKTRPAKIRSIRWVRHLRLWCGEL